MGVEERIRFLMQAAVRAEREGASRVARSLRRMAEQARPLEADASAMEFHSRLKTCGD